MKQLLSVIYLITILFSKTNAQYFSKDSSQQISDSSTQRGSNNASLIANDSVKLTKVRDSNTIAVDTVNKSTTAKEILFAIDSIQKSNSDSLLYNSAYATKDSLINNPGGDRSNQSVNYFKWIEILAIFILVIYLIKKWRGETPPKNDDKAIQKETGAAQNSTKAALKITNPFPTVNDIHVADEAMIKGFLNMNSIAIGSLKYLGTFIDITKIKNDIGIKAKLQFLIIEREEYEDESPGEDYEYNENGVRDIFERSYHLPDTFPLSPTETKKYIIASTVETYSCNPKEICENCNGSKRCRRCSGTGLVYCRNCEGTGKRKVADGKFANGNPKYKSIGCDTCNGSGKVNCSSCHGSGKCNTCNGTGEVTCSRCNGTGFYQTYLGYSTKFLPITMDFCHSDYSELLVAMAKTKNRIIFDDDLIEWKNKSTVLFDNKKEAIKANRHSQEFINSFEKLAKLTPDQRFGRIHSTFETVPITIVNYSFEEKDFQLSIVGEDNVVSFYHIPKKHSYEEANIFKRLMNFFSKKKREVAFVYVASYMFNSDGPMNEQELKLLELFLNNIKLKQEEKNILVSNLTQRLTFAQLLPKIKTIKGDKRALIFAWQCAIQDGDVNQTEITAFTELSELFEVKEDKLEKIKHIAVKFAQLKDSEMLEEYFRL